MSRQEDNARADMAVRLRRPFGGGWQLPASCADKALVDQLRKYKRYAAKYRTLKPDDIEEHCPSGELLVSTKMDGELWFLVIEPDGDIYLQNPAGRSLCAATSRDEDVELPLIGAARRALNDEVWRSASGDESRIIIAGELYAERDRPRHDDLAYAMGGEADADVDRLRFMAFDVVDAGVPLPTYATRIEWLNDNLREIPSELCSVVASETVTDPGRLAELFAEAMEAGAEGLVVRAPTGVTYKVKPSLDIDAVVVAFTERAEQPGHVRSLALALVRDDGSYAFIGNCGNMDVATRASLFERLRPLVCASRFRYASKSGAVYQPVLPELVVEVKLTDVISEHPDGTAIERMVANYAGLPDSPHVSAWQAVRQMPSVSILHPRFTRLRPDKSVSSADIGMAQVTDRVAIDDLGVEAVAVDLPKSTLLRREVYTKTSKAGDLVGVRKLMVWATNKADIDPAYPSHVVSWTDYSPNRADPLKRMVRRVSGPDEEASLLACEEIALEFLEKGVKRGWVAA